MRPIELPFSKISECPGGRLLEACCTSAEEVRRAIAGGAGRIELCARIDVGGVTPDDDTVREAVALGRDSDVPVNVLVRPRGGDFVYSAEEETEMAASIERARALGAAGVVIGALHADGSIDTGMMRRLIAVAHGNNTPLSVTFHRAFDECSDPFEALEQIIRLGCNRLLTSGQAPSAYEGRDLIAELVKAAGGRIIIMPGAGITPDKLDAIAEATGATEFHGTRIGSGTKICSSGDGLAGDFCPGRVAEGDQEPARPSPLH